MSRILNKITFVALLVVGFTILAHSTIPHDHHYDLGLALEHNHQHDEENSDKETEHCHFLNHIDLDKVTTNNAHKVLKQLPILYALLINTNFDNPTNSNFEINRQNITRFTNLKDLLKALPTRGSPLLFL